MTRLYPAALELDAYALASLDVSIKRIAHRYHRPILDMLLIVSRIVSRKPPPRRALAHLPKQRTRSTIILDAIQAAWFASVLVATGTAIIFNANENIAERRFSLFVHYHIPHVVFVIQADNMY